MDQQLLVAIGKLRPPFRGLRIAAIDVAVDEVVDHFDGMLYFEFLYRPVFQVMRDGGDAVALLDRKTRDGKIRPVGPHQSDVSPVQGGDIRQSAPLSIE